MAGQNAWARVPQSQRDRLREHVFARDGYRCQIRGPRCTGAAEDLDHIVPHTAGGALLDPSNCRASCARCNRGRGARGRRRHGWRLAATRIHLVVGPPAAGKTSWVAAHASEGDLVVDYDAIARALGSPVDHAHNEALRDAVTAARGAVLNQLRRGEASAARAWIISANPRAEELFPHHEIHVIDPGRDECLRRARKAGRPADWTRLISDWYARRGAAGQTPSREW